MARHTQRVLDTIDSVLGDGDRDELSRRLATHDTGWRDYEHLCGGTSEAVQAREHLVDNNGNVRNEDLWGTSHPDSCTCTLCVWPNFDTDEGNLWLAAGPGDVGKDDIVSGWPFTRLEP